MKTRILIILLSTIPIATPQAFGCSRDLSLFFWSPIIDRVRGDCSFVGFEPNPFGIMFTSIVGIVLIGFVIWRKRK